MAGFDNDNVYFLGIDTRGVKPIVNQMTTDGQLLIGSTAAPHIKAGFITAGPGVTVTNSSGGIQIGAAAMAFAWNTVTSATNPNQIVVENGYVASGGVLTTFTLPAAANVGDTFIVTGYLTLFQIFQNAGQSVVFSNQTTTVGVGGSLASTQTTDHIEIICVVANTVFKVSDSQGNFTIA